MDDEEWSEDETYTQYRLRLLKSKFEIKPHPHGGFMFLWPKTWTTNDKRYMAITFRKREKNEPKVKTFMIDAGHGLLYIRITGRKRYFTINWEYGK